MVSSNRTKLSICLAAVLVVVSSAFAPSSSCLINTPNCGVTQLAASSSSSNNEPAPARRAFVQQLAAAAAAAVVLPLPASAGLLEDFGSDPNKIAVVEKKVEQAVATVTNKEVAIDPTLRASYYYPTAKKRYLPRIQKVTENIAEIPQAIANGQWEEVQAFSSTAENAILPLQLYVSSLDGQGLSMANNYAKTMKKDALEYEKQYKVLQKALKSKDKDMALAAIQEMGVAVADYRQAGRLKDDDGNIPDVQEIRRSTMRRTTQAQFALNDR